MKVIASGVGVGQGRKCRGKKGTIVFHNKIYRDVWLFQLCACKIQIKINTVARTQHSQCRGSGFDPWSGNEIPHTATKSSYAMTEALACHN